MAIDQHYIWAIGHFVMLFASAYVVLQLAFFRGTPPKMYRLAYTGTLISYAVVINKSLGRPQLNANYLRRAIVDENVQYGLLALFWWISRPIAFSIIPFMIFSLFHSLTFLRTNIIPKFVPPPPYQRQPGQAAPPSNSPLDLISRRIQAWVKANYDGAMRLTAFAELVILAKVTLDAVTFRGSLITPLFMAHFIRLRYHASFFTRDAVGVVKTRIDAFVGNQGGILQKGWETAKRMISSWGAANVIQGGQAPAGAAGAAGGAGPGGAGPGGAGARPGGNGGGAGGR